MKGEFIWGFPSPLGKGEIEVIEFLEFRFKGRGFNALVHFFKKASKFPVILVHSPEIL